MSLVILSNLITQIRVLEGELDEVERKRQEYEDGVEEESQAKGKTMQLEESQVGMGVRLFYIFVWIHVSCLGVTSWFMCVYFMFQVCIACNNINWTLRRSRSTIGWRRQQARRQLCCCSSWTRSTGSRRWTRIAWTMRLARGLILKLTSDRKKMSCLILKGELRNSKSISGLCGWWTY